MTMNQTERSSTEQQCEHTFEEDKLALIVLVHGIYLGRQAPPEHTDEHGVSWHHRVIPHPPKPVVLKETQKRTLLGNKEEARSRSNMTQGALH